jgi:hypothetical protein
MKKQLATEWLREKLFNDFGFSFSDNIFEEASKLEIKNMTLKKKISNKEIKLASIARLKLRLEDGNLQIASADALGFFIGAEWYREQLKKNK